MTDSILSFEVYLPARGNPYAGSADGELTLRLSVPKVDRASVLELCDRLESLRDGDGTPVPVRLVAVNDSAGNHVNDCAIGGES